MIVKLKCKKCGLDYKQRVANKKEAKNSKSNFICVMCKYKEWAKGLVKGIGWDKQ